MADFVKVAKVTDVPDGAARAVEVNGRRLALFNSGGRFYAIDNACKHRGGPLAEGDVYGTRVVCPWHGWEYDFSTGQSVDDPMTKVACFSVKLDGDDMLVEV
jgi:nitrite reductase/ring-hydroxylating ferredoxin subunit